MKRHTDQRGTVRPAHEDGVSAHIYSSGGFQISNRSLSFATPRLLLLLRRSSSGRSPPSLDARSISAPTFTRSLLRRFLRLCSSARSLLRYFLRLCSGAAFLRALICRGGRDLGPGASRFRNHLQSSVDALQQSIDCRPIPLDSASSTFIQCLNLRVSTASSDLNLLDAMSFGTVSFEELLGHCNKVFQKNQSDLAQLEERLKSFGYIPGTLS
ncbi:hypothetical protein EUGRSUZ_C00285 [Eucalyptus grandis]|uniref:Uncharacterized protein n=2 Tax=Eucalyptus grandis TaxID=71139 RepID=A0A059CLQ6_EUCGR|nr:hypothetical protein EUGRSUZ_C00285 [Eucalyptus grandis]